MEFIQFGDSIVVNKRVLDFNDEFGEIPVNQESKMFVVIGNPTNRLQKIQLTSKDNNQRYEMTTEPEMISLKKGEACEFEITIKPLYSFDIEDEMMIVSVDIKKGIKETVPLKMIITTEQSTRLDPDEIQEEKKLGEGSFGIVFLGTFRGKRVAIKKMKSMKNDEKSMREFEKEVQMLDKFRSEYIINFYGACFVPLKISMVTEFAEYGSIEDLMKKRNKDEIDEIMKVKLMYDASKGIEYLHENGILHRDIKPDNFLVISLDNRVKVNCKLTDFGASRNINQMMTNMTFTKGIGTPIYMAPEVFNKQHYKKPADVYSFAVTMLEIMIWGTAFPKSVYKHPWDIANTVTRGNRPITIEEVTNERIKELIEFSWNQEALKRLLIEQIVVQLENELIILK